MSWGRWWRLVATGGRGRGSGAGVGRGQRQVSAGSAGLRSGGSRGAETPSPRSEGRGQRKGAWTAGRFDRGRGQGGGGEFALTGLVVEWPGSRRRSSRWQGRLEPDPSGSGREVPWHMQLLGSGALTGGWCVKGRSLGRRERPGSQSGSCPG